MSTHSVLCYTHTIQEHDYDDMTTTTKLNPFHLQPLLSDLYYHKDLLDFSAAGTSYPAAGIARANSRSIFPSTGSFRVTPIVSGIHSSRS